MRLFYETKNNVCVCILEWYYRTTSETHKACAPASIGTDAVMAQVHLPNIKKWLNLPEWSIETS